MEGTLRIIALVIRATDADLIFKQIVSTLYGKRTLLDATRPLDASRPREPLECLYFADSAFYRYRASLDGVMVVHPDGGGVNFWLNDHGNRPHKVRESVLGKFLTQNGALNDVPYLERRGFLVADCKLDRNCVSEVIQYVKDKYHLENPMLMNFKRYGLPHEWWARRTH